jgi:hypothetical protein
MNIYTPYTYFIGWSWLNTYYYGVKFAKKCHPSDLWVTYFTSSKYVHEFRELYGEPDIIEIRNVFNTADKARSWEHKVLKRIKAVLRKDFLNESDGKSIPPMYGDDNPSKRPDVREKISKKKKGVPCQSNTPESIAKALETKRKNGNIGPGSSYVRTPEMRKRASEVTISQGPKGPMSEERKLNLRKPKSNKENYSYSKEKRVCQYCNGLYAYNVLKRHENKCKDTQ